MTEIKLIPCTTCGKEVSKRAETCPHCGTDLRSFPLNPSLTLCPSCHSEISGKTEICPRCGLNLPKNSENNSALFPCPSCKKMVSPLAQNCAYCGVDLHDSSPKPVLIPCPACQKEISSNAPSCPYCGEVFTNGKSSKNWGIALLLCFFLGHLGVHRIYIRGFSSGLKMFLFSIIPYIGMICLVLTMIAMRTYPSLFIENHMPLLLVLMLLWLLSWVWVFFDFIRILIGCFKDNEGKYLKP